MILETLDVDFVPYDPQVDVARREEVRRQWIVTSGALRALIAEENSREDNKKRK